MKRHVVTVSSIAVVGLLLVFGPLVKDVSAEAVRIGVVRAPHLALIYLADSEGLFKKHKIDAVLKEYESGVVAVNNLLKGNIDTTVASEFVFVLQSFTHPDLRVLATTFAAGDEELVVRKDHGIARPQDLKGKRVAVVKGSSTEFFLYNYFIFNNIQASSVDIVYKTPTEMVKAMSDGTIDAALNWPPFTTQMANELGTKGASWPAQSGQDYYMTLISRESFLKNNTKSMQLLMSALSEAEQFIKSKPDQARTILQKRLGVSAQAFNETWSKARVELQLTQDLLVLMEREAKWAMRNKRVDAKKMPNYLQFIYFDALDKVKPEAVSIVHK